MLLPDTRYRRIALRTVTLRCGQLVLDNMETVTPDDGFMAGWAVGVLPFAHPTRQVARVDVVQPRLRPDLGGAHQRFDGSTRRIDHLIVGMEGRYMPRNIRRYTGDVA